MVSSPLSRPRTPSRSTSAAPEDIPPIPQTDQPSGQNRRPSFSFLRRGKSVERLNSKRSISGGKLTKKQAMQEQREAAAIPQQAPRIPHLASPGSLQTFGGEDARSDSYAIISNQAGAYHTRRGIPIGTVDMTRSNIPRNVPIPPVPGSKKAEGPVDPYARTESMTHRGRYSYASSAVSTINSPRRVRRRKDPTPFNVLVVGTSNCGKTAFLDFLKTSLALPARKQRLHGSHSNEPEVNYPSTMRASPSFQSHYLETETDDGERIGLTLWDSEGLEKNVVDLQLRELSSFLESKFEDTFTEEMKIVRSPGFQDTHIHCVFLILDPLRLDANIAAANKMREATNGNFSNGKSYIHPPSPNLPSGLDEDLDLQVLRTLQGKTTVVPVISKADTITKAHMEHLKRAVWDSLKKANLDPLEALGLDEGDDDDLSEDDMPQRPKHDSKRLDERDEDNLLKPDSDDYDRHPSLTSHLDSASSSDYSLDRTARHTRNSSATFPSAPATSNDVPYLPLSIISPDPYDPSVIGRKFPWGFADPYNIEHCDFVRLKEAVFKEWRGELREASRELWYERWRTSRLDGGGRERGRVGAGAGAVKTGRGPTPVRTIDDQAIGIGMAR